jgi:UDP:flavonoid glycosyltransferase YjiC (YdhE family)
MKFALVGYGTRGDIEPCTAVGRELLRRGHEVRMAVPPDLLGVPASVGLAAVAYGQDARAETNGALTLAQNWMRALPEVIERVTQIWADRSATLTSLAKGADLLVTNMNEQQLATNVADYHGIPLAALHVFPARLLPSGWPYSGLVQEAANAQRRALGLSEATGPSTRQMEDELLEIQGYDELCLPGPAAEWVEPNGRRPFVGVLTLELPTDADDEVLSWIAAGTPPIYFGFGSTPVVSPAGAVTMLSATCAQLGERALICSGANDFSGVPHFDHVKVVGSVNYAAVFPACRAVVHHGGSGTTAAGLRAGVPSLILWEMWDQPIWAATLAQLKIGAGRQLSATTEGSLVADLRSILTAECATRAREIAAQMSKPADSVAHAADLLEDVARRGRVEDCA